MDAVGDKHIPTEMYIVGSVKNEQLDRTLERWFNGDSSVVDITTVDENQRFICIKAKIIDIDIEELENRRDEFVPVGGTWTTKDGVGKELTLKAFEKDNDFCNGCEVFGLPINRYGCRAPSCRCGRQDSKKVIYKRI